MNIQQWWMCVLVYVPGRIRGAQRYRILNGSGSTSRNTISSLFKPSWHTHSLDGMGDCCKWKHFTPSHSGGALHWISCRKMHSQRLRAWKLTIGPGRLSWSTHFCTNSIHFILHTFSWTSPCTLPPFPLFDHWGNLQCLTTYHLARLWTVIENQST